MKKKLQHFVFSLLVGLLFFGTSCSNGIEGNLSEKFLLTYGTGTFYNYWFSDLGLNSLRDYLERGRDLVYFKTNTGIKLMIDRPYGDETIVVLDSKANFWVFNTKNENCTVKIQNDGRDIILTQGVYSYNTVYIYDRNGWAHNTWTISELRE